MTGLDSIMDPNSVLFLFWLLFLNIQALLTGDNCQLKNSRKAGKCVELPQCRYALDLLRKNQKPQNCGFDKFTPIVCCPMSNEFERIESTSTSTTTSDEVLALLPVNKQCSLYHESKKNNFFVSGFGGIPSLAREFPHMAILGYGDSIENVNWLCGGSLISDQFILTAAHCQFSPEFGALKFVRLGELDIKNKTDDADPQDFTVAVFLTHPRYKAPSHYHDIALIKLNRRIETFTGYIKPACLYTGRDIISQNLIATGWGKTSFLGEPSSHLLKMYMDYIDNQKCSKHYIGVSNRRLSNGVNDDIQVCAGNAKGTDTCPGDSGGPLQIKYPGENYHVVVGVTSFGKACGIGSSAGVYTRVSYYVSWIQEIVWAI